MTIYEELSHNLEKYSEFYRIEGGLSKNLISFNNEDFCVSNDGYLYISSSLRHHRYFTDKRIKQLIDEVIFGGIPTISNYKKGSFNDELNIAIENLSSSKTKLILYRNVIKTFPFIEPLLKQNTFPQISKIEGSIEACDIRHGKAYGITDEWLELFCKLIILVKKRKITNFDILEYLKIVRQNQYNYQFQPHRSKNQFHYEGEELIKPYFILESGIHNYAINPDLYNNYTKYDIINALEQILDKRLVVETSELNLKPRETVKTIVNQYQEGRSHVLRMIDSIAKRNLIE